MSAKDEMIARNNAAAMGIDYEEYLKAKAEGMDRQRELKIFFKNRKGP